MYEDTTYEAILQRMLARVPDRFDKREGSVIWDTHSPTAIELQILYIELDSVLREAYGDTASREFLILRCRERGIHPREATKAVLKGVFVPGSIDVAGQRFNIGDMNYVVRGKIADGEYQVECETAGKAGNQFFGAMIPMEYIKGLQSAELTGILIPGEDEEGTEELRQRYFSSFRENAFGGNRADYLEKTNAIPGVGRTKVTRVWNSDVSPADMIPKEGVETWYNGIKGTLSGDVRHWLDSVFQAAKQKKLTIGGTVLLTIIDSEFGPASETLVEAVQAAIDPEVNAGEGFGLAPIGHVVRVESAAARTVDIRTDITFEPGYGWGSLQAPIEDAVAAYLLELRKGWADSSSLVVRISQIDNRILNVPGIIDVQETLVNGARGNLELGEYEIPVLGGVSG
ncbi:baseplate J/gp47 family protein [uncultured Acetatifactor sp.]|uniref:baseplate J/gp47 family protein n=1 Tax=uncultured Acetatifactor sp. TaxID=1671927 RepID=UPI00260628F8|nr:baseplate J/gp47 family protein [uncultured Acetatifactor sp.]